MIEPKLRFKADDGSDFPDWEEKKFLDCISKIVDFRGRTPLKLGMAWSGEKTEYLALSALNVKMGYIDENIDAHYGNKKLYDMWMDGNELYKGQVLFTTEAPMGNVAQVPDNKPYILSQRTIAFVPKYDLLHDDFLVVLLSSSNVQRRLDTLATGGTAKGISQKSLKNFNVKIPCDLDEQQKIADFLSTIDTIIEKQRATVSAWEERKKGVMQKLFSQEVRFKADDGSDFPDWEEKKINDIATCFAGATPSTKIPEYWEDGTIQWMSSGEVNNGQIFETEKRISKLGFDKCSTKMVKPNTVVIALAGQGKTRGMVAITRISLCTNQSLCAIETNTDICDDYLYQYLQLQYNNLRLISSGDGTRGGLNLKLIGNYSVSIPSLSEQQKIADCLSALDAVIEKQKETLEKWQELKKGLLQQMFV